MSFSGSRPPVYSDREKLPFTVACLTETRQYYHISPLGVPQKTSTDIKVGHLTIPKDTGILYNIYSVHHDPELWEEPEKFRPERFLDPATGKLRLSSFPVITSGVGPRKCPGEKLAHLDMFYMIVRLMQRLSCSAADGPPLVDVNGLESGLFLTAPEQNIVLTRRSEEPSPSTCCLITDEDTAKWATKGLLSQRGEIDETQR
ncbi:steroid 17-alpha-hydroxylase/17,20 lyase-like [Dermacentor variabilis]|uniref:steroid 17-alpha-hydroxylase/17,20 lyase-like n=1 Tax=Dermacentor variabilis TaxID=34621 RepID=UPI003F5B441E